MIPESGEKNVYNVSVPALPEIATCGDSLEEARFMAQDAIELTILSRLEEGENIPQDKKSTRISKGTKVEEIVVAVDHRVTATPASHVKHALFQSA